MARFTRFIKKMPNFKFPKYKMTGIEDIEELNVEYTPEMIQEMKDTSQKKRKENGEKVAVDLWNI